MMEKRARYGFCGDSSLIGGGGGGFNFSFYSVQDQDCSLRTNLLLSMNNFEKFFSKNG